MKSLEHGGGSPAGFVPDMHSIYPNGKANGSVQKEGLGFLSRLRPFRQDKGINETKGKHRKSKAKPVAIFGGPDPDRTSIISPAASVIKPHIMETSVTQPDRTVSNPVFGGEDPADRVDILNPLAGIDPAKELAKKEKADIHRKATQDRNQELGFWNKEGLTFSQTTAANKLLFMNVMDMLQGVARGQSVYVKEHGWTESKYVTGLMDALVAERTGGKAQERLGDWGDAQYTLQAQVRRLMPDIEEDRNKIFAAAENWQGKDLRRIDRQTNAFVRRLPEGQKALMFERAGVEPEKITEECKRWGGTLGLNIGTTFANDWFAGVVAGAFGALYSKVPSNIDTAVHALSKMPSIIPPEVQSFMADPRHLYAWLGVSAFWWGAGMKQNLGPNADLLEQTGFSTSALSKKDYQRALKRQRGEHRVGVSERPREAVRSLVKTITPRRMQEPGYNGKDNALVAAKDVAKAVVEWYKTPRTQSMKGYVKLEFYKDIAWWIAIYGAVKALKMTPEDGIVAYIGSNVGAGIYEGFAGKATQIYLHMRNKLKDKTQAELETIVTQMLNNDLPAQDKQLIEPIPATAITEV